MLNEFSEGMIEPNSPIGSLSLDDNASLSEEHILSLQQSVEFMKEFNGIDVNILRSPETYDMTRVNINQLANTFNFDFKYQMDSIAFLLTKMEDLVKVSLRVDFIPYLLLPLVQHLSDNLSKGLIDAIIKKGDGNLRREDIKPSDIYGSLQILLKYLPLFVKDELSSPEAIGRYSYEFTGNEENLKETLVQVCRQYNLSKKPSSTQKVVDGYLTDYKRAKPFVAAALLEETNINELRRKNVFDAIIIAHDSVELVLTYLYNDDTFLSSGNNSIINLLDNQAYKSVAAIINKYHNNPKLRNYIYDSFNPYVKNIGDALFNVSKWTDYDFSAVINKFKEYTLVYKTKVYTFNIETEADINHLIELVKRYSNIDLLSFIDFYSVVLKENKFEVFKLLVDRVGITENHILKVFEMFLKYGLTYHSYVEYIFERRRDLFEASYQSIINMLSSFNKDDNPNYQFGLVLDYLFDKGMKTTPQMVSNSIRHSNFDLYKALHPTFEMFPEYGITEMLLIHDIKTLSLFIKNLPKGVKISTYQLMAYKNKLKFVKVIPPRFPGYLQRTPLPGSSPLPDPTVVFPGHTNRLPGSSFQGSPVPGSPLPGSSFPGSPLPGSPLPRSPLQGAPIQENGVDKDIVDLIDRVYVVTQDDVFSAIKSKDLNTVKDLFNKWLYSFTSQDLIIAMVSSSEEVINYIKYKIAFQDLENGNEMNFRIIKDNIDMGIMRDVYSELYHTDLNLLKGNTKDLFKEEKEKAAMRQAFNSLPGLISSRANEYVISLPRTIDMNAVLPSVAIPLQEPQILPGSTLALPGP